MVSAFPIEESLDPAMSSAGIDQHGVAQPSCYSFNGRTGAGTRGDAAGNAKPFHAKRV